MNNTRRREIKKVIKMLNNIKDVIGISGKTKMVNELIDNCYSNLLLIQMDEQDAFDNMPEGLQCSDRGYMIEENAITLEECVSMIEDLVSEDNLNEIINTINEIVENLEEVIL